jgi:hypothetical protein
MAATQEVDVLFKQLCTLKGDSAKDEKGFRLSVPQIYSRVPKPEVQVSPYGLHFTAFEGWPTGGRYPRHSGQPTTKSNTNATRTVTVPQLFLSRFPIQFR